MYESNELALVLVLVFFGVLIFIVLPLLAWREGRRHRREKEERIKRGEKVYNSWSEIGADLKNLIQKSSRNISEGFERDWKADRFSPHILIEQDVVLTYKFDGTKRPQPGLVANGLLSHIGKIFDDSGKPSESSAGIYALVDEKFREMIRANPRVDFSKFEDVYSVKILDVQRKHQLQSGIYVGE